MNATNSALLYPEILFDVLRVLEDRYPVGPSFVNSLSTLVEAVVIHDQLFLHSNYEHSKNSPWISYYASDLAKILKRENILVEPSGDDFEQWLSGNEYDYIEFLTDSGWTPGGFLAQQPEAEASNYLAWTDIVTYAPGAFSEDTLVDDESEESARVSVNALPLLQHGFSIKDLIHIEGYNRSMRGYQKISQGLGLHLYGMLQTVPHQLGAISAENSKARSVFEQLQAKSLAILDTDDAVGDDSFRRIDIPPLCQIVLDKCRGSRSAFFDELLALRERHKNLRKYLSNYEKAWNAANTKEDARRLKAELNQAFENLAKMEASPTTRWLYRSWDILKDPTKILARLGDVLVDKGKQYYAVDRVWGLHDFYKDLRESPLQKRNYALLESMFSRFAPKEAWTAACAFAAQVETRVLPGHTQRSPFTP